MVAIIPINIYPQVPFSLLIVVYLVVISENLHEVLCVVFSDIFHIKIINADSEVDQAPFMFPNSWINFTLVIAFLV